MFFRRDNPPRLAAFLFSGFEEEEAEEAEEEEEEEHADKDDETGKDNAHEEEKEQEGPCGSGESDRYLLLYCCDIVHVSSASSDRQTWFR
ncbi:hypothetical protein [Succinimonas sp.]|uniref:hypothetical protein n=1 Tax=Succinimonas sp. TaxID=1936151 RepID=UPI003870D4D5